MRTLQKFFLFFAAGAAALQASPVFTGTVDSHPFSVNGGGRFTGTINGSLVSLWCVDNQLETNVPEGFNLYRTAIDNAMGTPTDTDYDTRYENARFAYKVNDSRINAEFRFRMAAFLITQYDESLGGGHKKNEAIQNAIWKSTRLSTQTLNTSFGATDYFSKAEKFVTANYNDALFDSFRVVSAFRKAPLADSGAAQVQTFLTTVPEPGSYALMGSGLLGLLAVVRRRAKQR